MDGGAYGYSRIEDGSTSKSGCSCGKACLICCLICIGIVVLGIIGLIILLKVLLSDKFAFTQFTAEEYITYSNGHGTYANEWCFDSDVWASKTYYKSTMVGSSYCDGFDKYIINCQVVGKHDSCYKLTSGTNGGLRVSYLFSKKESNIDCPKIKDPLFHPVRKLSKCDHYAVDVVYVTADVYVEVETNYPVRVSQQTISDGKVTSNVTIDYTYFNGTKPTDKSVLKPPSGVKVWDFRDSATGSVSSLTLRAKRFLASAVQPLVDYVNTRKIINDLKQVNVMGGKFVNKVKQYAFLNQIVRLPEQPFGGAILEEAPKIEQREYDDPLTLPTSFDAREKWEECSNIIGRITNQKKCGSCWAMATAGAISDRACISRNSTVNYSPQYMVDCYLNQFGCEGGVLGTVYEDMRDFGIVSEKCVPFVAKDQTCPTKCEDGTPITSAMKLHPSGYTSPWDADDKKRVQAIQMEIINNGPVATAFLVFSKFSSLKNSVYSKKKGEEYEGGHMVRIIGWGVEDGVDYWLVANSWGTDWDENGYFKIRRGNNECNIENSVIAPYF